MTVQQESQEPATALGPLLLQTAPNNGHATAVEQSMLALSAKKGIIIPTAGARLALNHADDLGNHCLLSLWLYANCTAFT